MDSNRESINLFSIFLIVYEKTILFIFPAIFVLIAGGFFIQSMFGKNTTSSPPASEPTYTVAHVQYVTDLSDERKLIGASHNVFAGRILRTNAVTEYAGAPATHFDVEVLDNIKGNLTGTIDMLQGGGCFHNNCMIMDESVKLSEKRTTSLESGEIYLLATRSLGDGRYMLGSHPSGKLHIHGDKDKIERIRAFKRDYTQEVPLEADVRSAHNQNAFSQGDASQKQQIIQDVK